MILKCTKKLNEGSTSADSSPAVLFWESPCFHSWIQGFSFGFNWCRFPNPKRDDSGTMTEKDRPTGLIWPTLCLLSGDDKEALHCIFSGLR